MKSTLDRHRHLPGATHIGSVGIMLAALLLAGCVTTVAEIAEDPQAYAERTVLLEGRVLESISIPFADQSVSVFADETGKALIIASSTFEKEVDLTIRGRVLAFPEEQTTEAVARTTRNLSQSLVDAGIVGADRADRLADAIVRVASKLADRLGALFLIVQDE